MSQVALPHPKPRAQYQLDITFDSHVFLFLWLEHFTGPQDIEFLKNTSLLLIFKPSIPCLGFVWLSYDYSPARHSRLEHQEVHLSEGLTLEVHGGHLLLIDDFNFDYLVKMLLVLSLELHVSSQNVLLNNIFFQVLHVRQVLCFWPTYPDTKIFLSY